MNSSAKLGAGDDREKLTFRPEAKPFFAVLLVVGADIDEAVEAFSVDQCLQVGADVDVRCRFACLRIAFDSDYDHLARAAEWTGEDPA